MNQSLSPPLNPAPSEKPILNQSQQRIVCLWFPNWAIQRRVVSQPEFRKQQVVLFERDSRRGQLVAAVSPLAMLAGVQTEMSLAEAKSLLQRKRSTAFHILEHDPDADRRALEALADSLESFSPTVGLETFDELRPAKQHQPDCLLLDVTGLAHLFGDESCLAELAMKHCQQAGYLVRVAIADTVGLAWGTAKFIARETPLVLSVNDKQTLPQLPIEALRLPAKMIDTLSQLGVQTIEHLQRLDRPEVAMRFGHAIGQRLDQMTGQIEEPVIARRRPADFQAEHSLEFPTHHRETIEVVTGRLVESLCGQLRSKQCGALQWRVTLDCVSRPEVEFTIRLFQATATTAHVMPLLSMQLEQVLQPHTRKAFKARKPAKPKSPSTFHRTTTIDVQEITVAVTSSTLLAQHQRRLFDENPRLDKQALAGLINRLTSRIGSQNVVYPTLQSGAQPEYAFRLRPLVSSQKPRRNNRPRKSSHLFARPLRLFHPPLKLASPDDRRIGFQPVGAQAGAIALRQVGNLSYPPAVLIHTDANNQPSTQNVIRSWGPERIETGWWRGHTVCRDYWRVETDTQQHYWIFRNRRTRQWFVQGEF